MAQLQPQAKQQYFGNDGLPLVGGRLWTYLGGTNTPKATYSDPAGTAPNSNPVILDARGEALIFWDGTYKVVLQDSLGNPIYTVDNIEQINPAYRTSATGSIITPAGTTAQRDVLPQPGYLRWNTTLSALEVWSGASWGSVGAGGGSSSGGSGFKNKIIGGDCRVAGIGNLAYVAGTLMYGGADNILVAVTGGGAAGTIQQLLTGSSVGVCGASQAITGVNTATAGDVTFQTRIEYRDAIALANKQTTITAWVYHDVGVLLTGYLRVLKATAVDNFAARTILQTSGVLNVPSGTKTKLTFTTTALSLADVSNGLAVEYGVTVGFAMAGRTFAITDWQIEEGAASTDFDVRPMQVEKDLCARYLPSYLGDTVSFQVISLSFSYNTTQCFATVPFQVPTRVPPTGVVTTAASGFSVRNGVGAVGPATTIAFGGASTRAMDLNTTSVAGAPTLVAGQAGSFGSNNGTSSRMYFTGAQL